MVRLVPIDWDDEADAVAILRQIGDAEPQQPPRRPAADLAPVDHDVAARRRLARGR